MLVWSNKGCVILETIKDIATHTFLFLPDGSSRYDRTADVIYEVNDLQKFHRNFFLKDAN
jgi:hypothetical protein